MGRDEGEGRTLWRYQIDPVLGLEILVWAPNRVKGQHSTEVLLEVVERLQAIERRGGDEETVRQRLVHALRGFG